MSFSKRLFGYLLNWPVSPSEGVKWFGRNFEQGEGSLTWGGGVKGEQWREKSESAINV